MFSLRLRAIADASYVARGRSQNSDFSFFFFLAQLIVMLNDG